MKRKVARFIRDTFKTEGAIALHEPRFLGNERKYLLDCIDSTFVSSVGPYIERFESEICKLTGAKYAVAATNGTAALHAALLLAGVQKNDEVITQPLTFIATANAISYCGSKPVFVDIEPDNLGISPQKLLDFLTRNAEVTPQGVCLNKTTGSILRACVPVHTFGHPSKIEEIVDICGKFNICVVEDAAEAIGSLYDNKHLGTFGQLGIISFNGNKTITCGGGGVIITDNESLYKKGKHITTTAKVSHPWEYFHDQLGYNYRLPNINAALACAQLEQLDIYLKNKRELALIYREFFSSIGIDFFAEKKKCRSNYWLNTILLRDKDERDEFLAYLNEEKIYVRPAWHLLNTLPMYAACQTTELENSKRLADCILNIPSSVRKTE